MDIGSIGSSTQNGLTGNSASRTAEKVKDDSFEKTLKAVVSKNDEKELKAVCQQFEGIMLDMMYKQMKATIDKSTLMEEDTGRVIFEGMLDEKLMDQASKTGSLGLAEVLFKQLSKQTKGNEPVD